MASAMEAAAAGMAAHDLPALRAARKFALHGLSAGMLEQTHIAAAGTAFNAPAVQT